LQAFISEVSRHNTATELAQMLNNLLRAKDPLIYKYTATGVRYHTTPNYKIIVCLIDTVTTELSPSLPRGQLSLPSRQLLEFYYQSNHCHLLDAAPSALDVIIASCRSWR